jgi:hypothetical protein
LIYDRHNEPVSDIDTVVVDSLKALDPKRPIREADMISAEKFQKWFGLPKADLAALAAKVKGK